MAQARANALPERYRRLAAAVGGKLEPTAAGTFCRVTSLYPVGHPYGSGRLEAPDLSVPVPLASFCAVEVEGEVALADLLFFDTETTGLGGAGVVPFLIGFGSVTAAGFEVRQYLLPDYSDEAGMLERTLEELSPSRTAVSYNGTAFDLGIIRDRMIVNRVARQVPCAGHIDLLHSARRLYRRRLSDCSLVNIEREILGFHRRDDLPGYLVPSVYFDWLQTENTALLGQVLEHNRLDVLSLYFLLRHVEEVFRSEGSSLYHVDDVFSLSRVYGRRKRHDKVTANFERLSGGAGPPPADEVVWYHSLAFKRSGRWDAAIELWERLAVGDSREALLAGLELAKYYEHKARDLGHAIDWTTRSLKLCPPGNPAHPDLLARLERLRCKLKSSPS